MMDEEKVLFLQLSSEKTHATACQSEINVFKELAEKLAEAGHLVNYRTNLKW